MITASFSLFAKLFQDNNIARRELNYINNREKCCLCRKSTKEFILGRDLVFYDLMLLSRQERP